MPKGPAYLFPDVDGIIIIVRYAAALLRFASDCDDDSTGKPDENMI
jgi:hypothetical protein